MRKLWVSLLFVFLLPSLCLAQSIQFNRGVPPACANSTSIPYITTGTWACSSSFSYNPVGTLNFPSGAILNFGSSDVTLTHATGKLTFSGSLWLSASNGGVNFENNAGGINFKASSGGGPIQILWVDNNNNTIIRPIVSGGVIQFQIYTGVSGGYFDTQNAIFQMGASSATPIAQLFRGPAGSGTNIAGGNVTIQSGNSTGNQPSGDIHLQTAPAGGAGSALNTMTDLMILKGVGTITTPNLKATTGTRYLCVDTNGVWSASAAACSGT